MGHSHLHASAYIQLVGMNLGTESVAGGCLENGIGLLHGEETAVVWALGCIKMKLNPVEALAACTVNGAAAMELSDTVGSIAPGRPASFILTRPVPSLAFIPYAYTSPWIERMFIRGREMVMRVARPPVAGTVYMSPL